jgi:hypothetical protein
MEFTSPAGHINLRETNDPETGLKPNGTSRFPVPSNAVPGKGTERMKNVHFSGQNRNVVSLFICPEKEKNTGSCILKIEVHKQFK